MSFIINPYVGGAAADLISLTWTDNDGEDATQSSFSFPSTAFGVAIADRGIVVGAVSQGSGSARSVSSLTIGGVSAALIPGTAATAGVTRVELWKAPVPTGTTGTVVVNWSGDCSVCAIQVFRLSLANLTATDVAVDSDTGSGDPSTTIDIPAGGGALSVAFCNSGGACTMVGLTLRDESEIDGEPYVGASDTFASAQTGLTVTANYAAPDDSVIAVAAFGPA